MTVSSDLKPNSLKTCVSYDKSCLCLCLWICFIIISSSITVLTYIFICIWACACCKQAEIISPLLVSGLCGRARSSSLTAHACRCWQMMQLLWSHPCPPPKKCHQCLTCRLKWCRLHVYKHCPLFLLWPVKACMYCKQCGLLVLHTFVGRLPDNWQQRIHWAEAAMRGFDG